MKHKRGQFFLLAAIIISSLVLSVGAVANSVVAGEEPESFIQQGKEIKTEAGAVYEYELFTSVPQQEEKLTEFVDKVAVHLRDKDPFSNFLFVYGNSDFLTVRNYGSTIIFTDTTCDPSTMDYSDCDPQAIPGAGIQFLSQVSSGGATFTDVSFEVDDLGTAWKEEFSGDSITNFRVLFGNVIYEFDIGDVNQVFYLAQKGADDEIFVTLA